MKASQPTVASRTRGGNVRVDSRTTQRRDQQAQSEGVQLSTTGLAHTAEQRQSKAASIIQQLCEFKAQCGHCNVPRKYAANSKLGMWVSNQRSTYRLFQEGKHSPVTAERIRELEKVELKWRVLGVH